MAYLLVTILGAIGGGILVFVLVSGRWNQSRVQLAAVEQKAKQIQEEARRLALQEQTMKQQSEANDLALRSKKEAIERELGDRVRRLKEDRAEFDAKVAKYEELLNENTILKRDLQNVDVNLRKLELDRNSQRESQEALDHTARQFAERFLRDNVKWIGTTLTANNFVACKQRLINVIRWCRELGFEITSEQESVFIADLKQQYEAVVRAALEREEQARIKAQIREEQQLQREVDLELKRLEREKAAIKAALEKALAETKNEHDAQVEQLRARLADAEARAQRAVSQAQLTRTGHVYVISNVGSFGPDVYKIGMTRRLEPEDRIRELGDASVPFGFDVHMMVSSNDAPALENALHRKLHKARINKINPRKEFFKVGLETIIDEVKVHHGEVSYIADAEALEFRQSLEVSDEDQEFIEATYGVDSGDEDLVTSREQES